MDERAARFLDAWLQANIAERQLGQRITVKGLLKRCTAAARKEGLTLEELNGVVGDLEQAITDELALKKSGPVT